MSHLETNQSSKSGLNADENISKLQFDEKNKHRRWDLACQKEPDCPYKGFWRIDTKNAGGGRGLCKKCLSDEEEKKSKIYKDTNSFKVYNCVGINCTKSNIRIQTRENAL